MGGLGGGGRGGGGGMGGGMGQPQSPVDTIKKNLDRTNPLTFLLDRKKPLSLTKAQQDTLKKFRDELRDAQRPVYAELDKLDVARAGGRGPGGMGPGGRGGPPPGGGRDGGGEASRGPGGPDDALRVLAAKLYDIQDSFRDRARLQLESTQRVRADSLEQAWLAEERKKMEKRG